jgi:hypothetical protein
MGQAESSRARWRGFRIALPLVVAGLLVAACGDDGDSSATTTAPSGATTGSTAASGPQELVGLFGVDAGTCADAGVTEGSYFRMVQADGTLADGPFIENGDSTCGDKTWNPLLPGTDGGLRAGAYQPQADPVFDGSGNAMSQAIIQPVPFFAVAFGVATNETDPQTGEATAAPTLTADGGALSGDLSAFAASWNNQQFNQGSPKPDGSAPGNTVAVTGTFDEATGRYTLDWTSQITGGPFNNFTGVWHLEGTFEAG